MGVQKEVQVMRSPRHSSPPSRAALGSQQTGIWSTLCPALVFLFLSSGCEGEIMGGPTSPTLPGDCVVEPTAPELRRLSSDQYLNTLRDLFGGSLGEEMADRATYPETVISNGFATDASANNVNESESNQIEDNAAALSVLAAERLTDVMPCVTDAENASQIDGCIDAFITGFGLRAYRRPLQDSERSLIRSLYDIGSEQSARVGFQSVLEFFLQSPALLYQIEYGSEPVPGAPNLFLLDDYELATRLSYFIWNSTPDAQLLAAAAAGELRSREGMELQARRLVEDRRVFDTLETFHRDLTRTYRLDEVGREDPTFTTEMREAMRREGRLFLEAADARGELTFEGLFATDLYPVSAELADLYGVEPPGAEVTEMSLTNRRGILGLPSVMASIGADAGKNSTIVRAIYILEEVLCQTLPPFPGDIDVSTPLQDTQSLATARDRLAPTTNNATCHGCHQAINPPGFALEQYDSVGRYRTEENEVVIDAAGELGFPGASGAFSDSVEFLELIAESPTARSCYVDHWMHAALGRPTREADACTVDALESTWSASGNDIRELLVEVALTDRFRQREIQEEEE